MPQNSLKVTRNFRGGLLRMVRILAGAALLFHSAHLLHDLFDHASPSYDPGLSGQAAAAEGALAAGEMLVAIWFLKGTIVRACGVIIVLAMVIPVLIGQALWAIGLPDALRRVPLAILLVGCVIIYTGNGDWTLVSFALRQSRELPAHATP